MPQHETASDIDATASFTKTLTLVQSMGDAKNKPSTATLQLPSSDAAYLNNPQPVYPAISRRLAEQGKVLVRVLIGKNGRAQQVEVTQSSGYERLDHAALEAVLSWRYVPGQLGGEPQAMWYGIPISFKLN